MIGKLIRALFGGRYASGGYTPAGIAAHQRMMEMSGKMLRPASSTELQAKGESQSVRALRARQQNPAGKPQDWDK